MNKTFILIFFLLIPLLLTSKHQPEAHATGLPFFYKRIVKLEFPKNEKLPNPENDKFVLQYISDELINLAEGETLTMLAKRSNAHSIHILTQQSYKGYPVYGAQFKINYQKNGKILSYSNGFFSIPNELKAIATEPGNLDERAIVQQWLSDKNWTIEQLDITPTWLFWNGQLQAVLKINVNDPEEAYFSEWLVNAQGQSISEKDLNSYQGSRATANATVFFPDPVSSAETYYGGDYIDSNDWDNPALTNELKNVTIDVFHNSLTGTYHLQSNFLKIEDLGSPNIAPPAPNNPNFNFTRGQNSFEAVNTYYHIQRFAKHIESLGFNNLLIDQVEVDANGKTDDQSIFSPMNPPKIYFGEGGIDDAEDANVVVHEYGHYLSHAAAPFTNSGFDRTGIDEGLCDYFAVSYSKADNVFRWFDVFTWDGHNEFWSGRSAQSTKKYPDDMVSSYHLNGEILSSAMMRIQNEIGKNAADAIMVQVIYSLYENMKMINAGNLILQADTILFSGAHYCSIFNILNEYGLTDSEFLINACLRKDNSIALPKLDDKKICAGESVSLMDESKIDSTYSYLWSENSTKLIYQNQTVPVVSPIKNSIYELEVRASDGRFNTVEMMVLIEKCDFDYINTLGFAEGSAPMKIALPERISLRPEWIRLIDFNGRVIGKWNIDNSSENWELSPDIVPSGVYILQLRINNGDYKTKKVLRLN
ncbi:MAG: T9SS type A sorting domain-containing protein [Chitinophagales bacterium]